jgi:hypothetical protein
MPTVDPIIPAIDRHARAHSSLSALIASGRDGDDREDDAIDELLEIVPTTKAGLIALLSHIIAYQGQGKVEILYDGNLVHFLQNCITSLEKQA